MKLLGREISVYAQRIPEIPSYLGYLIKCFRLFKRPHRFILAYVRSRPVPGRTVELRSGLTIHLSNHPHDVISVFVVFVREDYGKIEAGSTVADIGANIGLFSIYAAMNGAAKVHAYEPSSEAYSLLLRNIETNHLEQIVVPKRCAVVGTPGERVKFPTKASMYNAIIVGDGADYEWVDTIGLPEILDRTGTLDLLKLDCEGAEYEILLSAGEDDCAGIKDIRLEYHAGLSQELENHLAGRGFVRTHVKADTENCGTMWYEKSKGAAAPQRRMTYELR